MKERCINNYENVDSVIKIGEKQSKNKQTKPNKTHQITPKQKQNTQKPKQQQKNKQVWKSHQVTEKNKLLSHLMVRCEYDVSDFP